MAHGMRVAATRTIATTGMAVALLAAPFAASSSAVDVDADPTEPLDTVEESVDETVDEVKQTAEKATDAAKETVQQAGSEPKGSGSGLPPSRDSTGEGGPDVGSNAGSNLGSDAGSGSAIGDSGTTRGASADLGTAGADAPVDLGSSEPAPQARGERTTASTPVLQPVRGGLASWSRLELQAAQAPVVSGPLAPDTPQVATDLSPVPAVVSMAALEDVFAPAPAQAVSAAGPMATGVPGSLVVTATGLIMLLGSAHALHASGRLAPH